MILSSIAGMVVAFLVVVSRHDPSEFEHPWTVMSYAVALGALLGGACFYAVSSVL